LRGGKKGAPEGALFYSDRGDNCLLFFLFFDDLDGEVGWGDGGVEGLVGGDADLFEPGFGEAFEGELAGILGRCDRLFEFGFDDDAFDSLLGLIQRAVLVAVDVDDAADFYAGDQAVDDGGRGVTVDSAGNRGGEGVVGGDGLDLNLEADGVVAG